MVTDRVLAQREYTKGHYQDHKDDYKARAKVNNIRYRNRNRAFILDYLNQHPCADCGETDPIVLQFDHTGEKTMMISRLVNSSYSIATLAAEVERCEVVCANCHFRRTAARHGAWYKAETGAR